MIEDTLKNIKLGIIGDLFLFMHTILIAYQDAF